ncbi:MAG: ATPase [Candidatus Lambdaproteobacteria bacterium RIFOXYD1_FULL_56_27]|uniref:ATPase n=1 Tax=Candidatus Lambdaproteobacteria bacterium RIFOXYD2_FULL_56_26 TaxID=1817773 RepID=A0A1F6GNJ4_9PROT|nr:MAG: ATPase [Candidatus Lambdaproteobacteria bacterium RIFOXYD2_FULL_56_26]OGG99894.1 MAG: ATPase [Candidatus Lambdaproteobacteria bacterium RIFOXYC1_FULL_56_13]OGH06293.1 MAG: ATPase [Candidatus Lambdaproteobacteria bacterium RIFOXYD1_FULL_56_27]
MYGQIKFLEGKIADKAAKISGVKAELAKVIVGQAAMVDGLLVGLFTGGHVLLEGLPGLAKTLTVKALSQVVALQFSRIQFTPDMLPADLVGTMIFNPKDGSFSPRKGPVFSNLVLADEINRAPAKVQSALLEVMQEKQVTLGSQSYALEEPFLVLATQNPIEQEGTYPLPEAQVDRFMMKLKVGYPTREEEREILNRVTGFREPLPLAKILEKEEILEIRGLIEQVYLDEKIKEYIVDLVFATREPQTVGLGSLSPLIEMGASPRASITLAIAAKALALFNGKGFVTPQEVKQVAPEVLRHRILASYEAEAESVSTDEMIGQILGKVKVP